MAATPPDPSNIDLHSRKQLDLLVKALKLDAEAGAIFRSLTVDLTDCGDRETEVGDEDTIMEGDSWISLVPVMLSPRLKNLQTIRFRAVNFSRVHPSFCQALSMSQRIEKVEFRDCMFLNPHQVVRIVQSCHHVTSLEVIGGTSPLFINPTHTTSLARSPGLQHLRSLTISIHCRPDAPEDILASTYLLSAIPSDASATLLLYIGTSNTDIILPERWSAVDATLAASQFDRLQTTLIEVRPSDTAGGEASRKQIEVLLPGLVAKSIRTSFHQTNSPAVGKI